MTLKELKALYATKSAEMRSLHESTKDADWNGETRSKWEAMRAELAGIKEKIEREEELRDNDQSFVEERARLENRNDRTPADDLQGPDAEQRSAFSSFLRHGVDQLTPEQRSMVMQMRAQGTTGPEAGGYTVPTTLQTRVVEALRAFGGIASVAQLLGTDNGAPIAWVIGNGEDEEGELIGEYVAASEGDVTFGMGTLGSYTISSKIIRVSEQLLADSGVDIEGFLAGRIGSRQGRTRARLLVKGTGAAANGATPEQPRGLEVSTSVGKVTAAATKVTWQEVNGLIHSIDPAYRAASQFRLAFNDSTLQAIEELVDGNNRPLWLPGIDAERPATILKQQYVIDQAIADIGAGNKFMYAGDFNQLILREVRGMTLKRLVERFAEYGQVGFLAFTRFGVVLQDVAAIKALQGKPAA